MRTCNRCGETKPLEQFHRDKTKSEGRKYICAECSNGITRDWYSNNREYALAYHAEYAHQHPEVNKRTKDKNRAIIRARQKATYWTKRTKELEARRNISEPTEPMTDV